MLVRYPRPCWTWPQKTRKCVAKQKDCHCMLIIMSWWLGWNLTHDLESDSENRSLTASRAFMVVQRFDFCRLMKKSWWIWFVDSDLLLWSEYWWWLIKFEIDLLLCQQLQVLDVPCHSFTDKRSDGLYGGLLRAEPKRPHHPGRSISSFDDLHIRNNS